MALIPFKGFFYEAIGCTNLQIPIGDARRQACANIELNAAECLEAYGVVQGYVKCKKFAEDMNECRSATIEQTRQKIMQFERAKKLVSGEIPWEKRKGPAYNYSSYISATFYP